MIETREFSFSKSEYRRFLRRMTIERHATTLTIGWLLLAWFIAYQGDFGSAAGLWRTLAGYGPLLLGLLLWSLWIVWYLPVRMSNARAAAAAYRPQRLRFDDTSLQLEVADGSRMTLAYSAIDRLEQTDEFFLIRQDCGAVNAIPRHAFTDQAAIEQATEMVQRVRHEATPHAETHTVADRQAGGRRGGLLRNLRAGLRLLLFRRVEQCSFAVNADQLILLSLVAVLVSMGGGYLAVDGEPEFSAYGLLSDATSRLLLLLAIYLIARWLGRTEGFLPLSVILVSVDPWISVIQTAADALDTFDAVSAATANALRLAIFVWYLLVWARAARVAFPDRRYSVPVALLVLLGAVVAPAAALPFSPFWYAQYEDVELPRVNVEKVFYRQQDMVTEAVAAMRKQRPGVVDLYHVGFGSDANQRVFRQEIGHVRQTLDERFDTAGRSMSLVNHVDSVDDTPIASASNLALALDRIAGKMDTDEDVLLLYLTSHGSRNGQLAVDFWPLQLNPLSAGELRKMLDASGIRWRVIIVSACYSGSFINALRDDNTIVITAAAHDRNSFGCSNKNEYTYFGEAYFEKALQQTVSFVEGYDLARQIVTERERAERLEPSNPAIHVGSNAAEYLKRLEQRLAGLRGKAS